MFAPKTSSWSRRQVMIEDPLVNSESSGLVVFRPLSTFAVKTWARCEDTKLQNLLERAATPAGAADM